MIKIKIAEVAQERGFANAYALQNALKCSPTMASRLWKGNFKQIGISTLSKLCDLFECDTSELLSTAFAVKKLVEQPALVKQTVSESGLLSTIQVAERLGLSRKRINDYIISGGLKSVKGKQNHNFVLESDLQEFIAHRSSQAE
jgi:DNA-binding Xre family transcriptional regulator